MGIGLNVQVFIADALTIEIPLSLAAFPGGWGPVNRNIDWTDTLAGHLALPSSPLIPQNFFPVG